MIIRTTPPARSTWHLVPPGEIHYGTFTDVYGFEMRPGWAYRCGLCPQVGVGYRTARSTLQGARKHRDEHCGMRIVALPSTARSATLAETWDPLAETWDSEGLETVTTEDDLRTSPRDVPVREDAEMDENVGALPSFEAEDDWTWSSWTEIFPGGEAYSGTYEAGDLTGRKIEDITPAQIEQVLQVYASSPEGYGSVEYAVVAHLKDGRFASSYGWADMTGWDCRSDALWKVGPTLDAVLAEIEPDMRVRLKPVGGA